MRVYTSPAEHTGRADSQPPAFDAQWASPAACPAAFCLKIDSSSISYWAFVGSECKYRFVNLKTVTK